MKFGLNHSTLQGSVYSLINNASAAPFIQPWYLPIETSPQSTGISMGGLSSSYCMTPTGSTPSIGLLSGLFVTPQSDQDLPLARFFFSEKKQSSIVDSLYIPSYPTFNKTVQYLVLVRPDKKTPWFTPSDSPQEIDIAIEEALHTDSLYSDNLDRFTRWQSPISLRTKQALQSKDKPVAQKNALLLLDLLEGALLVKNNAEFCLEADSFKKSSENISHYSEKSMHYNALYPLAQTEFQSKKHQCKISRLDFSPIISKDEKLCTLPISIHRFTFHNPGKDSLEVSLLQAIPNFCGYDAIKARPGVQDALFNLQPTARFQEGSAFQNNNLEGIILSQQSGKQSGDLQGQILLAVDSPDLNQSTSITSTPRFYLNSLESIVKTGLGTGTLSPRFNKGVYSGRELEGGAVSATIQLAPGETRTLDFFSVFDFPSIQFPGFSSQKKYTSFYSNESTRSSEILQEVAQNRESILERIANDHIEIANNILEDPAWKKSSPETANRAATQMINNLSYLADAVVWDVNDHFWARECADYPFFNSLDVYFYGSFSILHLLPRLDACTLREFGQAILAEKPNKRRHHEYATVDWCDLPQEKLLEARAVHGAVIHDLGSPFDPFPDAYDWHNVKEWKDLAPKYWLMVWRHYILTQNESILEECREAVQSSLNHLISLIPKGENIPLTRGTDDTFDNLSSHGISIYSGSLWIAGLRATAALFQKLGDLKQAEELTQRANLSVQDLQNSLWDEKEGYYHFYHSPIILDDFLNDQWEELQDRISPLKIPKANNILHFKNNINGWLNQENVLSVRLEKKKELLKLGSELWNSSFQNKMELDSDDLFADQLLADTFLELLQLEPISSLSQKRKVLKKLMDVSLRKNSPGSGIPNLVEKSGETLEAFQAQDIWMGVQFSIACAQILAGLDDDAVELIETAYTCLYDRAKIPFAAPEGFNASCSLSSEEISEHLNLSTQESTTLFEQLIQTGSLLKNGRIHPEIPNDFDSWVKISPEGYSEKLLKSLHLLLMQTSLKFTAGRYFRPGMIYAIPFVRKVVQTKD